MDQEVLEGILISDHGLFSSYDDQQEAANEQSLLGFFQGCTGLAPASPAQGLHLHGPRHSDFPYFCIMCGLEVFGFVDQVCFERDLSALLPRTLAVCRPQQPESIEFALDVE